MCQCSDDSEDVFLGQIIQDFAGETIDAIFLDQPTNTRNDLMNGLWPVVRIDDSSC
jgi:hypothetical protein